MTESGEAHGKQNIAKNPDGRRLQFLRQPLRADGGADGKEYRDSPPDQKIFVVPLSPSDVLKVFAEAFGRGIFFKCHTMRLTLCVRI